MDDPHVEDINFIIGIAARGNLGGEHMKMVHQGEDKISDELTPSLFKRVVTNVVTFANPRSPSDVLIRPTLNPNPSVFPLIGKVGLGKGMFPAEVSAKDYFLGPIPLGLLRGFFIPL